MTEGADADSTLPDDRSTEPDETKSEAAATQRPTIAVRLALIVSACIVVALSGLLGWFGYSLLQAHRAEQQQELFLRTGRQGALNLTTVNYAEVDADVRRILDGSIGTFHDNFQQRSQPYIDAVKRGQSKTQGAIVEAGLQSVSRDSARVLVVVTVKTSNAGVDEPHPRSYRMRIDVQKVTGGAKVSNAEFIP